VTTEVCVQYTKTAFFNYQGTLLPMKEWLRAEWQRSGLPLSKSNEACRVRNAATRKYLTKDHLWYFPPPEAFVQLASYANKYGRKQGTPYFSTDGKRPISKLAWSRMRPKFHFENGITNVWRVNGIRGRERMKVNSRCIHLNKKPLELIELCIRASSDPGDVIWEPFGGLCSVAIGCSRLHRRCFSAEINKDYFQAARRRLESETTHERSQTDTSPSGPSLPFP